MAVNIRKKRVAHGMCKYTLPKTIENMTLNLKFEILT